MRMRQLLRKKYVIMWLFLLYVGTYVLLMRQDLGAYRGGVRVFHSSFVLARPDPTPRATGNVTITMPGVTVFNYVYYPLDVLCFGLKISE